jgi:hypothetical protein
MFSHEGSTVFSGANQMLVRSGNREKSWGALRNARFPEHGRKPHGW